MEQPASGHDVEQPTTHPPVDHSGSESVTRSSVAPATSQVTLNESFGQLDMYAEQLRVKLPLAPPGLLNFYMSFVPWVAVIFGVLGLLLGLLAIVGSTVFGAMAAVFGSPGTGLALIFNSVIGLAGAALDLIGGWLMIQRKATGWWLLAIGLVIGLLANLLHGSILGLLIVLAISYVHLQVKPNYR